MFDRQNALRGQFSDLVLAMALPVGDVRCRLNAQRPSRIDQSANGGIKVGIDDAEFSQSSSEKISPSIPGGMAYLSFAGRGASDSLAVTNLVPTHIP